jgi:hypothetical protein
MEEIEADGSSDPHSSAGDLKFLLGLSVPALVLLALFAWLMLPDDDPPPPVVRLSPTEAKAGAGGEGEAVAVKTRVLEIESLVKGFLAASTEEQILQHVRDPERTAPKLKTWLAGRNYSAPGFREMVGDTVSPRGEEDVVTVTVRTLDFEAREIVIIGAGDSLKVDWESWVGWSEMSWTEFKAARRAEGKWFRVHLSSVEYYNFDFSDDRQWACYRLDSPDGVDSVFGYVPRNGDLDEKIRPFEENTKVKLLLKLRFPADARTDNQVLIEEVSGHEWVESPDAGKP